MAYIERDIEKEIVNWLNEKEIIAIRGTRQCGKTTLLRKLKEKLLESGVKEEQIHYFTFEDDLIRMKFKQNPKEFIEMEMKDGKNYLLIDEIQYEKEAGKNLKLIYDTYENIKIIITGSSSLELTNIGSYLVGRIIFFTLYPFSFREFLRSKGEKYEKIHEKIRIDLEDVNISKTIYLEDLNKFLHEYLTYGSYPRVALEDDKEKKKILLQNLFTTYIEKDIVGMYGTQYRDKAVKLLKTSAAIIGQVINYETLTNHSDLKYNEIREIIPLLEDTFVIFAVKPFYKNLMNELRKNPKIYFMDYGLRNHLMENFDNIQFDFLYENFIHNELKRNYKVKYWRTTAKTEVDFIIEKGKELIPIEVKKKPELTRSFRSFIEHYKPKKALMFNESIIKSKKIESCSVYILPFVYL